MWKLLKAYEKVRVSYMTILLYTTQGTRAPAGAGARGGSWNHAPQRPRVAVSGGHCSGDAKWVRGRTALCKLSLDSLTVLVSSYPLLGGVLKSPTTTMMLSVSHSHSVNLCFTFCVAITGHRRIHGCFVFLVNFLFIVIKIALSLESLCNEVHFI